MLTTALAACRTSLLERLSYSTADATPDAAPEVTAAKVTEGVDDEEDDDGNGCAEMEGNARQPAKRSKTARFEG